MRRPKAIITDIEGTTTPMAFVKDRLFPYARAALPGFVAAHGEEPGVRALLDEARVLASFEAANEAEIVAVLLGWIDEDHARVLIEGCSYQELVDAPAEDAMPHGVPVAPALAQATVESDTE